MKYLLLTGFVSLALTATASFAEEKCGEAKGNMIVGKVTLQCLKITGTAKFDGTTIAGNLHITGPLEAKSAKLSSLKVAGVVTLTDTTVSGPVNIAGTLEAKNTTFLDKILFQGKSASFTHSTLKDIEITSKASQKTTIYLEDDSVINGNITFKNGNGLVKNHHATLNGKIIGGKMAQ
ncbi:MAG: hypothetical protein P4M14_10910 [Gammaproteobacteria bacterium]|nr:hypothetical protein [Gammaproteobacteria bacterium]